jgi:hypothetical protein
MARATREQGDAASMGANSRSWSKPPIATRHEHVFSSAMAILILGTVALGFARTYYFYFAGVFRAPLPSWVIHVHGVVFCTWILLPLVQTSFVSAGRVDLDRRLGMAGFGFACLMIVLRTLRRPTLSVI